MEKLIATLALRVSFARVRRLWPLDQQIVLRDTGVHPLMRTQHSFESTHVLLAPMLSLELASVHKLMLAHLAQPDSTAMVPTQPLQLVLLVISVQLEPNGPPSSRACLSIVETPQEPLRLAIVSNALQGDTARWVLVKSSLAHRLQLAQTVFLHKISTMTSAQMAKQQVVLVAVIAPLAISVSQVLPLLRNAPLVVLAH